jgi:hypothetical protein
LRLEGWESRSYGARDAVRMGQAGSYSLASRRSFAANEVANAESGRSRRMIRKSAKSIRLLVGARDSLGRGFATVLVPVNGRARVVVKARAMEFGYHWNSRSGMVNRSLTMRVKQALA